MFSVLEIVFPQDPVTGGVRVTRQLLVLFENVLRIAPHLDAFGTVGIKRPVGILRWLRIAAATATTAIAPTLALHTFEISHTLKTVRLFPERQFGGYAFSLSGLRPGQNVEDASVPRLPPLISSARGPF